MDAETAEIGPSLDLARSALEQFGLGAKLVRHLEPKREALEAEVCTLLLHEVPAFSASGNPEVMPDLKRHIKDYLAELLRLLGGGEKPELAFVRTHAERRAAQRFPLWPRLRTCLRRRVSPHARRPKRSFPNTKARRASSSPPPTSQRRESSPKPKGTSAPNS